MKRRVSASVALVAGFALAVGPGGLASFADDAVEPEAPIVEVIETETPEVETLSTPLKSGHERLPICHSGSGANWTWIEPDANGYNGHKNHDHDIVGLSEAECLAKNTPPFDWNWTYPAPTCDGLTVTYPENIPAGQSNDVNIRVKNLSTDEERTFNFHNNTGTWSGTETFDVEAHPSWPGWSHYAYTWTQVAGTNYHWEGVVECGEAPEQEPEPVVCTLDGDWFSESDDAAPVLTIDGLRFVGGTGKATGIGHQIDGDFSTFSGASIAATGDTASLYYRLVIDSSADGGWSYQSLTVTDGLEVTPSSLAYSNKVGETKTIAQWQALYPNAVMTFEFIHLDSAAAEGVTAYVTDFESGCGENAWGIEEPEALSGTEEFTLEPVCTDPLDGTATVETWGRDWTQGYVPNEDRTGYVLGEKVFGEAYLIGSETVELEDCVPVEEPPVKEPPVEEPPVEEPPVVEPPVTPVTPTTLPNLGAADMTGWVIVALIAVAAGGMFVAAHRRRNQQ